MAAEVERENAAWALVGNSMGLIFMSRVRRAGTVAHP